MRRARFFVSGIAAFALAGCAASKIPLIGGFFTQKNPKNSQHNNRTNTPEQTPEPKPTPTPTQLPRYPLSSDEVWLIEMLIQRLELSAAISSIRRNGTDSETDIGELAATMEQAARFGLARDLSQTVFSAQTAAAAKQSLILGKTNAYPAAIPNLLPALLLQRDAVDRQIAATLLRMKRLPSGKSFNDVAATTFEKRGIHRQVAEICLRPFPKNIPTKRAHLLEPQKITE